MLYFTKILIDLVAVTKRIPVEIVNIINKRVNNIKKANNI